MESEFNGWDHLDQDSEEDLAAAVDAAEFEPLSTDDQDLAENEELDPVEADEVATAVDDEAIIQLGKRSSHEVTLDMESSSAREALEEESVESGVAHIQTRIEFDAGSDFEIEAGLEAKLDMLEIDLASAREVIVSESGLDHSARDRAELPTAPSVSVFTASSVDDEGSESGAEQSAHEDIARLIDAYLPESDGPLNPDLNVPSPFQPVMQTWINWRSDDDRSQVPVNADAEPSYANSPRVKNVDQRQTSSELPTADSDPISGAVDDQPASQSKDTGSHDEVLPISLLTYPELDDTNQSFGVLDPQIMTPEPPNTNEHTTDLEKQATEPTKVGFQDENGPDQIESNADLADTDSSSNESHSTTDPPDAASGSSVGSTSCKDSSVAI